MNLQSPIFLGEKRSEGMPYNIYNVNVIIIFYPKGYCVSENQFLEIRLFKYFQGS